jgi:hypothetical protein
MVWDEPSTGFRALAAAGRWRRCSASWRWWSSSSCCCSRFRCGRAIATPGRRRRPGDECRVHGIDLCRVADRGQSAGAQPHCRCDGRRAEPARRPAGRGSAGRGVDTARRRPPLGVRRRRRSRGVERIAGARQRRRPALLPAVARRRDMDRRHVRDRSGVGPQPVPDRSPHRARWRVRRRGHQLRADRSALGVLALDGPRARLDGRPGAQRRVAGGASSGARGAAQHHGACALHRASAAESRRRLWPHGLPGGRRFEDGRLSPRRPAAVGGDRRDLDRQCSPAASGGVPASC